MSVQFDRRDDKNCSRSGPSNKLRGIVGGVAGEVVGRVVWGGKVNVSGRG